jgi:hypothetical protein
MFTSVKKYTYDFSLQAIYNFHPIFSAATTCLYALPDLLSIIIAPSECISAFLDDICDAGGMPAVSNCAHYLLTQDEAVLQVNRFHVIAKAWRDTIQLNSCTKEMYEPAAIKTSCFQRVSAYYISTHTQKSYVRQKAGKERS